MKKVILMSLTLGLSFVSDIFAGQTPSVREVIYEYCGAVPVYGNRMSCMASAISKDIEEKIDQTMSLQDAQTLISTYLRNIGFQVSNENRAELTKHIQICTRSHKNLPEFKTCVRKAISDDLIAQITSVDEQSENIVGIYLDVFDPETQNTCSDLENNDLSLIQKYLHQVANDKNILLVFGYEKNDWSQKFREELTKYLKQETSLLSISNFKIQSGNTAPNVCGPTSFEFNVGFGESYHKCEGTIQNEKITSVICELIAG